MRLIKNEGTHNALKTLYSDDHKWGQILDEIGSGKEAWLDIADLLIGVSDAGPTFELHLAMAVALGKNPKRVLASNSEFDIEMICSWADERLDKEPRVQQLRFRRASVLKAANREPSVSVAAATCVKSIDERIEEILQ